MEAAWRERGAELGQQTPYGPDGPPTQSPEPYRIGPAGNGTSPTRARVRVAFLSVVVLAAVAVLIPSLADLPTFIRSSDRSCG
jgi:hypothetical protein